jgi:hypothetical protein
MFPHPALSHTVNVQGWSVREFKNAPLYPGARFFFQLYLSLGADYYITTRLSFKKARNPYNHFFRKYTLVQTKFQT